MRRIQLLVAFRSGDAIPSALLDIHRAEPSIDVRFVPVADFVREAAHVRPDVLLLDHPLPEPGDELLPLFVLTHPDARLLFRCEEPTPGLLLELIRHGASGCVPLAADAPALARAVTGVHEGQTWFGRTDLLTIVRAQLEDAASPRIAPLRTLDDGDQHAALTEREREILGLIGQALSNKEIARRLQISAGTVKTHLHRIYVKLHRSGRYKAFVAQGTREAAGMRAAE